MCSEHREPSAIYFHYIRQQAEKKIRETRHEWISRAIGKKFVKFWCELSLQRLVSPVPGTRKAALEHTATTDTQPVCALCACMTGKQLSKPLRWWSNVFNTQKAKTPDCKYFWNTVNTAVANIATSNRECVWKMALGKRWRQTIRRKDAKNGWNHRYCSGNWLSCVFRLSAEQSKFLSPMGFVACLLGKPKTRADSAGHTTKTKTTDAHPRPRVCSAMCIKPQNCKNHESTSTSSNRLNCFKCYN